MNIKTKIIYLVPCIFFILACFFSVTIYTSLMSKKLPWYEPCGMQFLAILVISCPAMVMTGISYIVLGRFMRVGKPTKILPFATAVAIASLIFIDGSLGSGMQITGTAFCVMAAISSMIFGINDLIKGSKSGQIG
ncbi:MAG: hypothetical protein WBB70_11230 [Desulfobacterales bacterium]